MQQAGALRSRTAPHLHTRCNAVPPAACLRRAALPHVGLCLPTRGAPRPQLRMLAIAEPTTTTRSENGLVDAAASVSLASKAAEEVFTWTRNWWPVSPVEILDTERPTAHTLLGQDLVVWYSKAEDKWNVFKDMCPHRLAPLSQGRIVDSSLVCSYHGWGFGTSGACNKIPQADPQAEARACSSKRTCATHYPTMIENGCVYVWLDNSEQGVAESKVRGVPKAPRQDKTQEVRWSMLQVQNDLRSWLEQGMDPAHAPHLHAGGAGFKPENAIPMAAPSLPSVHPTKGFEYAHGGYEKKNATMNATRTFIPPGNIIGLYRMATGTLLLNTMFVPVQRGVSRTYASFDFLPPGSDLTIIHDSKAPPAPATTQALPAPAAAPAALTPTAPASPAAAAPGPGPAAATAAPVVPAPAAASAKASPALSGPTFVQKKQWFSFPDIAGRIIAMLFRLVLGSRLPHWVTFSNELSDQDVIIMHYQEQIVDRNGLDNKDYVMPAVGADIGVAAVNRWLRMVKYPESLFGNAPMPERLSLEQLLDRRTRHMQHCVQCQQGVKILTKICTAVTAASGILTALSMGLLAAGLVRAGTLTAAQWGGMTLATGGLAVTLAVVAVRLWDLREERFVSGVKSWRAKGGLSLVKGM